ncbi:NAD-P-binding protein [Epithele typhae]|uniref:NAD-P-binding protein n=1 Tax=Epithele typhae TaxID=378194 RepID=UPI002008AA9D|nr:NAD-P-binding protein [Epithele typhae]KAH9918900.1 NAD-P-binding protein [Epithele typhae]
MSPICNARVLFKEFPGSDYPVVDQHLAYDDSQTVDPVTDPLDGGFLVKVLYLSVDPYLRRRMTPGGAPEESIQPFAINEPLVNYGVGVVLRSEHAKIKAGSHLVGFLPFQEYVILPNDDGITLLDSKPDGISWSAYIGVLGMPGLTAYSGWNEFSRAKPGETVFVTAASGAVGAVVVQLAKLSGCKVIASAGSEDKVEYARTIGADVAFNWKKDNTREILKREGPINICWDNVGGESLEAALDAAASHARFIICGSASNYNTGTPYNVKNLQLLIWKEIHFYGFLYLSLQPKHGPAFLRDMPRHVAAGEVKFKEHLTRGLARAGDALLDVLRGGNFGKSVIVVAEE